MADIKNIISELISNTSSDIDAWFDVQYARTPPPIYSSVDLRHSGHKLVPVDTNLFPAGFNLLSENGISRAGNALKYHLKKHAPKAENVLLVPENHTRNRYYLQNVHALTQIIIKAGLNVQIGGLETKEIQTLETANGNTLTIHPIRRENNRLLLKDGWVPDVILVNNDLSSGKPALLESLDQCVIPPLGVGWYRRRKTQHFDSYYDVARRFANEFGFDSWQITALFERCGTVNFREKRGLECVALAVEKLLNRVSEKYQQYGIADAPYAFIKADSGTYGMGIMTVRSSDEIHTMNKKIRNKMNAIKEGIQNSEVIIQEGIPTIDTVDDQTAEPMVYLVGGTPVGCTYRVHSDRDRFSNLNATGMRFTDISEQHAELCPVQGLIARLASLAATRECYEPVWTI